MINYDYKRKIILYVDDELKSLKYFDRLFRNKFRIMTVPTAEEAVTLLDTHADEIAILFTDQRMPGMQGVELLQKTKDKYPDIIRILVTAYADMEAAISAVNNGEIYRYITKPWDIPELETTLTSGMQFYTLRKERKQLMRFKLNAIFQLLVSERILDLGLICYLPEFGQSDTLGYAYRSFANLINLHDITKDFSADEMNDPSLFENLLAQQRTFLTDSHKHLTDYTNILNGDKDMNKDDLERLKKIDSNLASNPDPVFGNGNHWQKPLAKFFEVLEEKGTIEKTVLQNNKLYVKVDRDHKVTEEISKLFDPHNTKIDSWSSRILAVLILLDKTGLVLNSYSHQDDAPWVIEEKEQVAEAVPGNNFLENIINDDSFWSRLFM